MSGWPTRWLRPAACGTAILFQHLAAAYGPDRQSEVANLPGFGPMLLPGPSGFQHDQITGPSIPATCRSSSSNALPVVDPAGPWQQIALNIPRMLEQRPPRLRHGLGRLCPRRRILSRRPRSPGNADSTIARRQLRRHPRLPLGRHARGAGSIRAQILNAIPGMGAYLADHDAPPEKVSDQGIPLAQDGPVGFSAAVLPYLRAFPDLRVSAQQTSA